MCHFKNEINVSESYPTGAKKHLIFLLFIQLPSVLISYGTPFGENTPQIWGCLSSLSKSPFGRVGGPKKPQALGGPKDRKEYLKPGQTGLCFSPVQARDYYQCDPWHQLLEHNKKTRFSNCSTRRQLCSEEARTGLRPLPGHGMHQDNTRHHRTPRSSHPLLQIHLFPVTNFTLVFFPLKYSLFHECISLASMQSEYTETLYYSPFLQHNLKRWWPKKAKPVQV